MAKRHHHDETAPMFPIGALAARSGLSPEGIRFYEAAGLLPEPARTEGRRRIYSLAQLKRLIFIRRARDLGFTLDEVRALLRLADTSPDRCAEARNMAAAHLTDVRKKIAALRTLERVLTQTVARCDAGTEVHCPLIDALNAAATVAAKAGLEGTQSKPSRRRSSSTATRR
jgi:MerR family mercuric resistance operon transcriptional regulator